MATKRTGKPPGRPRIEITDEMRAIAKRASSLHCTDEEIAALIGISRDTLVRRKKEDPSFAELLENGKQQGKASLRRLQWKSAESGNVAAQIWLGKNILGQRDYRREEVSHTWDDLPERDQLKLARLALDRRLEADSREPTEH